jgi:uncharacterized protein (TIGR03067 family)
MKRVLAVAGLLVAAAVGVAGVDDRKRPDADTIRGAWKVTSAKETAGFDKNIDVAEYQDSVWTFGAKDITIMKGKAETKLAYALDPAKKPKQIDLGTDLAGKGADRPFLGIYELDGDRLTICYTVFNERPSGFSMGKGIAAVKRLVVLERQRK